MLFKSSSVLQGVTNSIHDDCYIEPDTDTHEDCFADGDCACSEG